MITSPTEVLDADELLHLALRAAGTDRHEEAITYLKRALDLAPDDGRLHYMLGAEHAQIGMYDRAAEEMAAAVKLDPNLTTAQFQLGLLHLTSGRPEQAETAWEPLDALDANHFLRLFKTGLEHLARDEFAECADYLKRGIAANNANPMLNQDLQRLLKDVEARLEQTPPVLSPEKTAPAPRNALLSAYRRNRADDKD